MNASSWRRGTALLLLSSVLALPTPALAGTETLKRSVSNILSGPFDIVLCPITGGMATYRNIKNIDDSTGVRVAYALPGYIWMVTLFAGTSVLRVVAGFIELLPGIVLLFTDSELGPLFAPADRAEGLWEWDTPVVEFKVGIDYSAVPY